MGLREELANKLSAKELRSLITSFDIIGSREGAVAILEIPPKLMHKKRLIAQAVLKVHKPVITVLNKLSARSGKFRLRKYQVIAGGETEVVHREHGCSFKLDIRKVYFSPREATERERIASQVRPRENVFVMFSGVCPYPIIIAKKQRDVKQIYAIELNPVAHKYALENVRINKLQDKIVLIKGDVKEVSLKERFDRIIMPLPKGAGEYLDIALNFLKRPGFVHYYSWAAEPDLYTLAEKTIRSIARKQKRKVKILRKKRVLPCGPRKWKIVFDLYFY